MKRAAIVAGLFLCVAASVSATPQGFVTDLPQAEKEAGQTGKLIFAYFREDG